MSMYVAQDNNDKQPGSPSAPSFQLDRQDTRRDARKVCSFMSTAGLWAANAGYRFRTRSATESKYSDSNITLT